MCAEHLSTLLVVSTCGWYVVQYAPRWHTCRWGEGAADILPSLSCSTFWVVLCDTWLDTPLTWKEEKYKFNYTIQSRSESIFKYSPPLKNSSTFTPNAAIYNATVCVQQSQVSREDSIVLSRVLSIACNM